MCFGGGGARSAPQKPPAEERAPELIIDAEGAKAQADTLRKRALAKGRDSLIVTPGLVVGRGAAPRTGSGIGS